MYSGTTISYHRMQLNSEDISASIFRLHIESFKKILHLMAALFFLFFGLTFCMDTYYYFTGDISKVDIIEILMLLLKQLVNMLGLLTGIFCVTAVRLESRGSSLKLTKIMTIFSQLYVVYLIAEIVYNYPSIQSTLERELHLTQVSTIYFLTCLLLVLIFFLKFFIGKSKQYNSIITQAILDNTKRILELGGSLGLDR